VYRYEDEAACDRHVGVFKRAVETAGGLPGPGFAAIKVTALGNPLLLERMSSALLQVRELFKVGDTDGERERAGGRREGHRPRLWGKEGAAAGTSPGGMERCAAACPKPSRASLPHPPPLPQGDRTVDAGEFAALFRQLLPGASDEVVGRMFSTLDLERQVGQGRRRAGSTGASTFGGANRSSWAGRRGYSGLARPAGGWRPRPFAPPSVPHRRATLT
jgi:hypothetical protein